MPISPERFDAFIRQRIEKWLSEDRDRTATQLAHLAGITPTTVSTIRSGKRGVGLATIRGLARAWSISHTDLEKQAEVWWREQEAASSQQDSGDALKGAVVLRRARFREPAGAEPLEHLPNLKLAAEFARNAGVSEQAIRQVLSMARQGRVDASALDWLDIIRAEERRIALLPHQVRVDSYASALARAQDEVVNGRRSAGPQMPPVPGPDARQGSGADELSSAREDGGPGSPDEGQQDQ